MGGFVSITSIATIAHQSRVCYRGQWSSTCELIRIKRGLTPANKPCFTTGSSV
ncbi:hypothetical protein BC939DRAFT_458885 [Gamsiella multidivaricata]|uniref:uncharacterized protein n=1 Tax=Gamsiella multidivaricata TaxID=101098 RepID=UPI00221F4DE3|nr:uncharacterized protein BC939DRAFT_458885 [Gamsiella multidivaricata]KAI7819890.1 hypothetical protein BC939DRAFT_458885 [Gamsiella multidivaricata]